MDEPLLQIDISWRQQGLKCRAAFDIPEGVTALIGPSGAGKTSLARMITGLDTPISGTIRFKDNVLFNSQKNRNIRTSERNIGLVMQQAALFPHLTVEQNIRFSSGATTESIANAIQLLDISSLLNRDTATLSGGETKRVAIARAIAALPTLLILDEPMNGLDPKARAVILPMIKNLAQSSGVPVIMITHHLEDMLRVADYAVLMRPREVVTHGSLEQVLTAPECNDLLGIADAGQLLTATVTDRRDDLLMADLGGDTLYLPDMGENLGSKAILRIFASDISIAKSRVEDVSIINQLEASITHIEQAGNQATLTLKLAKGDAILTSQLTTQSVSRLGLKTGDLVFALIKAVSVKDIEY